MNAPKMSGRRRAMLVTSVAIDYQRKHDRLPSTRSLALIAGVHPATARRWVADLKAVLPKKASALTAVGA